MAEAALPRTIVVTGATGETGRATCALLTKAGHHVVAVGTHGGRLSDVAAASRLVCDVTDFEATAALAASIRIETGVVDGVIHLVGGWRGGQATDDWEWLEPRLIGSLRSVTLAFRDDLSASDAGRLAIVGSTGASKPTWSNANYATLKAAEEAWMSAAASGWRKAGTAAAVTLVVTSIGGDGTAPGVIASEIGTLWDRPAAELNGTRIDLSAREN